MIIGSGGAASFPCFSLRFGICDNWVTYNIGSSTYKRRQEKEQNPGFVVWMPVVTSATNVGSLTRQKLRCVEEALGFQTFPTP